MKSLLLTLLAALALPTGINAETVNLECAVKFTDWVVREDLKEEDQYMLYIDIDTKKQYSTVRRPRGIKDYVVISTKNFYLLNFKDDKKKYMGESIEINRINGSFTYASMDLRYEKGSDYFNQGSYEKVIQNKERLGALLLPIKAGGFCRKAKKINPMF